MSGSLWLDGAALAVSLFNTLLLAWLGLTVLLTAERRTGAVSLVGGSLLLAAAFFVSHTALLGLGAGALGGNLEFWWRVGGLPVTALPCAWYAATLWFGGFWDEPAGPFQRRHRPWLLGTAGLGGFAAGLLLLADPIAAPAGGPLLGVIGLFPIYSLACLLGALDALRRPGPVQRRAGELARQRARPWLITTTALLLGVSGLVAAGLLWAGLASRDAWADSAGLPLAALAGRLLGLDLVIAALIGATTVCAGQAIVAYEVFTGEALPRGSLRQHWRNAIGLAAGYGLAVGAALTINLRPVYAFLGTGLLLVFFLALFDRRAAADHEALLRRLRPFVAGAGLVDQLLLPGGGAPEVEMAAPLAALCTEVLTTRWAALAALGPLAPLAGPPLVFGGGAAPEARQLPEAFRRPATPAVPLAAGAFGAARWAVPLWSERGLIGVLWLGTPAGGGPYTREEIAIARATGERLLDTQVSAELARRLLAAQRERLAESQVLDRRARRVVHDAVLPEVQAALLQLHAAPAEAEQLLTQVHRQLAELLRAAPAAPVRPEPGGLVPALRALLTEEFAGAFEAVTWQCPPEAEQAAAALPALAVDVLFHAAREAVRNAARHGRPAAGAPLQLRLSLEQAAGLRVVIEDDGVGWAGAGPAGHGLALHGALLGILGGALRVEGEAGRFTRVSLELPAPAG